ncbi:hypothetical protein ABIE26_002941 [Pedobacter africanus]|uniref:hypothetical protein n=1 Tax=Pedobacter africanus TaxID=151894 RepID=UPI003397E009
MELTSLDYLKRQVLYTGFGNVLDIKLEQNVAKELIEFQLTFSREFGKDKATALLYFSRSEKGQYFFNKYDLEVKNELGTSVTHTFYVNNKARNFVEGEKPKHKTFTVKEAYNQLSGRFVLKTMDNKEGIETTAWRGIDFTERNENGRFKAITFPAKNLNVGKALKEIGYPIKEMEREAQAKEFISSIERGDKVYATLISDGQEFRRRLVADPEFRSLKIETPIVLKKQEQEVESKGVEESNSQQRSTEQRKSDENVRTESSDKRKGVFKFLR